MLIVYILFCVYFTWVHDLEIALCTLCPFQFKLSVMCCVVLLEQAILLDVDVQTHTRWLVFLG
jgi:hypothetical protein